jgi:hypothetical protein
MVRCNVKHNFPWTLVQEFKSGQETHAQTARSLHKPIDEMATKGIQRSRNAVELLHGAREEVASLCR